MSGSMSKLTTTMRTLSRSSPRLQDDGNVVCVATDTRLSGERASIVIPSSATLSCWRSRTSLRHDRRMPDRDLVLLAYDIVDDRRRARALDAVRGFGIDGQLSVHECRLSPGERRELWQRLVGLARDEDRLLLLILDPRARIETLGTPRTTLDPLLHYIG